MPLELKHTERGFAYANFTDRYGNECSIQKSSVATEDCIWLGIDVQIPEFKDAGHRMHLSREKVAELLPILCRFVNSGDIDEQVPGPAE